MGRWQGLDWRRLDLGRLMMSRAGFVVAEGRLGYENCVLIPGDLRSVLLQSWNWNWNWNWNSGHSSVVVVI